MKILITGAKGFIGKNLIAELKNKEYYDIYEYDKDTDQTLLEIYCREADFVFHLAGVNRPKEESEYMEGNSLFTLTLLNKLIQYKNTCPVMISSSIQAELHNPYGISKKAGEDFVLDYSKKTGARVMIYRFSNVFGKWCRPNYNSAVATFCYNVAHDIPIQVNAPSEVMNLVYIDDVVEELVNALEGKESKAGTFSVVPVVHTITLGKIAELIFSFKRSREECLLPDMSDAFTKKLYSTYLSYLPEKQFKNELKMNVDQRGSFTEFIKTPDRGQISVNISRAGITKGNHWHHTKNEKFLVVSGKGVIRLRRVDSNEILEYIVSGEKLEVVDIPPGYTHSIKNTGDTDMVTIIWANEQFNPEKPDTYFMEV